MSSKITIETGQKQQQQRSPRIAAVSRTDAASTSPLSNLQQQHQKNVQPSASKSHTISKRPSLSSLSEVASTRQQDRQRQACKPANTTPRPSVSVSSVFQPQTGIPSPEMTPTNSDVQHDKIKHNFEDADQQILPSFQNDGTDHIKFQYKCIKKYGATSKLEKEHAGKSSDLGDSTVGQSLNAFDAPTCHPLETAYECSRCIEANCDLDKLREEHQSTLDKLAQMDETLANQSQLIATYRKEITSLEQTIDELKRAGMETIELYETSLHRHDTDMKRYTAKLAGAHAKIQSLEAERQKLVEAREASEALVDRHKHEKMEIQDAFERQRREMEQIISELQEKLKQQNQVEEFEKMKTAWQSNLITIEEQLEASKRALTEERNCHQKTRDERDTLASQLQVIQKNIQEKEKLHQQRIRELEQSLADASEKQQSMAEQLTRLREQQAAMEHHLLTAQENLSKAQTTIAELQDQLGKSQFTQSQWASRLRELESENSQLRSERQMIQEAHQNLESECARLQGQLKELPPHPPDANNFTDQQLVRQLQAQLGEAHREIELLRREKAAEAERYAAREQSHRREVNTLYRDISQLESLIEAKTFKEVDLLETLEHERRTLKSLLENRHSRNSICECGKLGIPSERRKTALSISSVPIITTSPALEEDDDDNDDDTPYCEICQVAGHDLMGCTALLEQISPNVPIRSQVRSKQITAILFDTNNIIQYPVFSRNKKIIMLLFQRKPSLLTRTLLDLIPIRTLCIKYLVVIFIYSVTSKCKW